MDIIYRIILCAIAILFLVVTFANIVMVKKFLKKLLLLLITVALPCLSFYAYYIYTVTQRPFGQAVMSKMELKLLRFDLFAYCVLTVLVLQCLICCWLLNMKLRKERIKEKKSGAPGNMG